MRVRGLYGSSVGKKILMAVTGAALYLFLIGHMIGNLKVFMGPEAFNHYAEGLRTFGSPFFSNMQVLWLARIGLLAAVLVHIVAAVQVWSQSRKARDVDYKRFDSLAFSYASRTMLWGGLTILAFVIYHLLDLTVGVLHPDFRPGDAYHNFVADFRRWPVTVWYVVAMIPLGMHLYHGFWSGLQTLGANNPRYNGIRRPIALVLSLALILGFISGPLGVVAGIVD